MDRSAATSEREPSEFGSGIVVCLTKFSEHLWNRDEQRIRAISAAAGMTPDQLAAKQQEAAQFPHGDAARFLADARLYRDDPAEALSSTIAMWMNGASDHFYELDDRAPEPLKELAALTLRIGHGFTDETWTMEHVEQIRDLWQKSCLAVDAMLGVEADWGSW